MNWSKTHRKWPNINMHGDKVIIVADATYIYFNKSMNFDLQRITYNDQKKRNFIKPMIYVTTNGTFVDIFCLYKATQNDATIMKQILIEHIDTMKTKLQRNDIFMLDRGFRDCVKELQDAGFDVKMPALMQNTANWSNQLTTRQANESRVVTACRFVVEARNGHLKSIWKIFNKTWSTIEIPHLLDDLRIAAALINRFWMKIESNKNDSTEIADKMKEAVNSENAFSELTQKSIFQSKVKLCKQVDAQVVEFPVISLAELRKLELGSYQLSLTRSYIAEHFKKMGNTFELYEYPIDKIEKEIQHLLKKEHSIRNVRIYLTKMFSRFRNDKYHMVLC